MRLPSHCLAFAIAASLATVGIADNSKSSVPTKESDLKFREVKRPDGRSIIVVDIVPVKEEVELPPKREIEPEPSAPEPFVEPRNCVQSRGPALSFFAEMDFLHWWYRGSSLPPIVSTGSAADFAPAALGQGSTFSAGDGLAGAQSARGFRLAVGGTIDGTFGVELAWLYTQPQADTATIRSTEYPILARTFYDTATNSEGSFLFGFPTAFDGSIAVATRTSFWGLEANLTANAGDSGFSGFVGYRYLQLTDDLQITGQYNVGPNGLSFLNGLNLLPGAQGTQVDQFSVENDFHGAQFGGRYRSCFGRFGIDVRASLAVGQVNQRLTVQGATQATDGDGQNLAAVGGLLAQNSNIGTFQRDTLTVVPEIGAKAFFNVTQAVSFQVGYNVLYWGSVLRAADQIDRVVDTRQSPTSTNFVTPAGALGARPIVPLSDTSFWAQGVSVGLRLEY